LVGTMDGDTTSLEIFVRRKIRDAGGTVDVERRAFEIIAALWPRPQLADTPYVVEGGWYLKCPDCGHELDILMRRPK
jgi:hypothetical protein